MKYMVSVYAFDEDSWIEYIADTEPEAKDRRRFLRSALPPCSIRITPFEEEEK